MKTLLITATMLLALANTAWAKLQVKISVDVSDNKIKNDLQEAIEARLNSTERYSVTQNGPEASLFVAVYCIILENQSGYRNGVACDSEVTYYPYGDSPVSTSVEEAGHLVVAGLNDTPFIVEKIMNRFINGTTDSKLAERKTFLRSCIQLLCAVHPDECKLTQMK